MPTQAEYVDELRGDEVFLGYVVATFSAGRFASTIILGYVSNHFKYRSILLFCAGVAVFGNILYFVAGFHTVINFGKWILLVSRFILGVAAGVLSVVRAYCVEISTKEERTGIMAIQTATQYFGFAVTPILGGWFSSIGTIKFPFGDVDSESMPAFIMAIVCIVTMIGLIFMQEPVTRNVPTVPPLPVTLHHSTSKDEIKSHSIAFFVFIALNVLTRMALSVMETLGGMLFGQVFPSSSALGTGVYYGVLGFIGMAVLIGIIFLSKRVQDSFLLLGGLILMELGQLFLISNDIGDTRFVIGTGITWAIGFPLAQTLVVSMFSKVVTSPKQGVMMGWIGAGGSLGRVIGPIISGYIYGASGFAFTFLFAAGCSLVALVVLGASWRHVQQKK